LCIESARLHINNMKTSKMTSGSPAGDDNTSLDLFGELIDGFATTLSPEESATLEDVREFFVCLSGSGRHPLSIGSDDQVLSTYLLHLRTTYPDANETALRKRLDSIQRFYEWAHLSGKLASIPISEFDRVSHVFDEDQISWGSESGADAALERELARLRALNHLAQELNRSADVQGTLNNALETLVKVMGVQTAWVSLLSSGSGRDVDAAGPSAGKFELGAAYGLPPALEQDDRAHLRQPPDCRCQSLLRSGKLTCAVNMIECARLQNAAQEGGDTQGLRFHATVPIISQGRPLGNLNVATNTWRFLSDSDLQFLSAIGAQVAVALERARLYDLAQAQRSRMELELELARRVQASLLPSELPNIAGFDLAGAWRSATEVAGDFYDVFPLADGRWVMVIADVAGKGAPAALCMMMIYSLIRMTAKPSLRPAEVIAEVNRSLAAQMPGETFVTVLYAILDPTNHTVTFTNAGHNRPIVRRASRAPRLEELHQAGLPIGLFDEISLTDVTISLDPGDVLVTYTDGLTESFDAYDEMFGEERLLRLIEVVSEPSAQGLVDRILADVAAFEDGMPQSDDITLLLVRRRAAGE
jgi:serine phosphatase RsbU (regulator of sigma subunit)